MTSRIKISLIEFILRLTNWKAGQLPEGEYTATVKHVKGVKEGVVITFTDLKKKKEN